MTTAASIWATAAGGIAAGLGHTGTAAIATVFMLLVLVWLRRLGKSINRRRDSQDDKPA